MPSAIKTNAKRAKKLVLRAGHVMRWSRGHDAITWFSSRGRTVFEERGVCGGRVVLCESFPTFRSWRSALFAFSVDGAFCGVQGRACSRGSEDIRALQSVTWFPHVHVRARECACTMRRDARERAMRLRRIVSVLRGACPFPCVLPTGSRAALSSSWRGYAPCSLAG